MNIIIQLACLATLTLSAYGQTCKEMDNCNICPDPELLCYACAPAWGLHENNKYCKLCSQYCVTCAPRAGSLDVMECSECAPHYILKDDKTCEECGDFCNTCQWFTRLQQVKTCTECQKGTVLWNNPADLLGECLRCPDNCVECTADIAGAVSCSKCRDAYYKKTSDGTCKSCPSRCSNCVDDGNGKGSCSKCFEPWTVRAIDPTKSCLACPSSCTSCSEEIRVGSIAKCTACPADRWLSADECVLCESNNRCVTCADLSTCSKCKPGFQTTDAGQCDPCKSYCNVCDQDIDECDTCQPGYGAKLSTAVTCDLCGPNCVICTSDRKCSNCRSGFALDVGAGTCKACPANCNSCSYDSTVGRTKCTTGNCAGNRIVNNVGDCTDCPLGCSGASCREIKRSNVYRVECTSCNSPPTGTFMQFNTDLNICQYCPTKCDSCQYNSTRTEMECLSCVPFYGRDFSNTGFPICTACDGCAECTYNSTATSNMDCTCSDYTQSNVDPSADDRGDCTGTTGNACPNKYVFMQDGLGDTSRTNDYCAACTVAGCLRCNTTNHCFACDAAATPPYASESTPQGDCISCPSAPICTTCVLNTAKDATECTACSDGYGVNDNKVCQACGSGCRTCSMVASVMTCDNCYPEYANNLGTCEKCDGKCAICSSSTQCSTCKTDKAYALSSGKCYNCPANCVSCSYDTTESKTICSSCTGPYVLDPDTGECLACPEFCNNCQLIDGSPNCIEGQCFGHYGRKDSGLCEACPNYCWRCSANDEDVLVCDDCDTGYRKNVEVCGLCPSKCSACSNIGGTMVCSSCFVGYALDSDLNKCISCPSNCNITEGCGVSNSKATCKKCRLGFGKSTDSFKCTACATLTEVDSCSTCTDQKSDGTATCNLCIRGYTISDDNGECIDNSPLGDGCIERIDKPRRCDECSDGFGATENRDMCVVHCYTCGVQLADDGTMIETPSMECNDPNANHSIAACPTGTCAVRGTYDWVDGERTLLGAVRGCFNMTADGGCAADKFYEECRKKDPNADPELCEMCCTTDLCNSRNLDGFNGASFINLHALLFVLITTVSLRQILPIF